MPETRPYEWERRATFTIYSSAANGRSDRGNALTLNIDAWTKRRYIIDTYRSMLRAKVDEAHERYPDLAWRQLLVIWRGTVRRNVFDLLFAAHIATYRDPEAITFTPDVLKEKHNAEALQEA